jgi:hypothetical protein
MVGGNLLEMGLDKPSHMIFVSTQSQPKTSPSPVRFPVIRKIFVVTAFPLARISELDPSR